MQRRTAGYPGSHAGAGADARSPSGHPLRQAHVVPSQWSDHVERDDEMDDENYQTREVYAKFGLAVYFAQVLEAGVVNLLTIARIFPDRTATREDFTTVMENYFRRTFGSLRTAVTPYLGDDTALLNDLQRAVAQRNTLIHGYW